jgi:hypothetical protein
MAPPEPLWEQNDNRFPDAPLAAEHFSCASDTLLPGSGGRNSRAGTNQQAQACCRSERGIRAEQKEKTSAKTSFNLTSKWS